MTLKRFLVTAAISLIAGLTMSLTVKASELSEQIYQPLIAEQKIILLDDLVLDDPAREERQIDYLIRFPAQPAAELPVIIWSHGALGSKDGYQPLAEFWAAHGYVVIQPTHEDSAKLLKWRALNLRNVWNKWDSRIDDVKALISALPEIKQHHPILNEYMSLEKLGTGGHSFGAHTTQLIAGTQPRDRFKQTMRDFSDPRPQAFLALSPQGVGKALVEESFQGLTRPTMIVTGDNDTSFDGDEQGEWRKQVYDLSPDGERYLLWVNDAYHGLGGVSGAQNYRHRGPDVPEQVAIVQAVTTAYWDCYLRGSDDACALLSKQQQWQLNEQAANLDNKLVKP